MNDKAVNKYWPVNNRKVGRWQNGLRSGQHVGAGRRRAARGRWRGEDGARAGRGRGAGGARTGRGRGAGGAGSTGAEYKRTPAPLGAGVCPCSRKCRLFGGQNAFGVRLGRGFFRRVGLQKVLQFRKVRGFQNFTGCLEA